MYNSENRTRTLRLYVLAWGFFVSAIILAGCDRAQSEKESGPRNLTRKAVSVIDGMILLDYPGPKGQALKKDGAPDYFYDVPGLINALLDLEQAHRYNKAYVQSFDGREWRSYAHKWIGVFKSVYVLGSDRMGAMGPALVSFVKIEDAQALVEKSGRRILKYSQLTLETMAEHASLTRKMLSEGGMGGKMTDHGKNSHPNAKPTRSPHGRK